MSADRYELARLLRQLVPAGDRRHRYAAPPFIGYLERPSGAFAHAPSLTVQGWVFNRGRGVRKLVLTTNVGTELDVAHALARPDVASQFPGEPHAAISGFQVALPLAAERGQLRELELWAYLDDGRRLRCFRLPWSMANGVGRAFGPGLLAARALQVGRRALDAGALRLERPRLERDVDALLRVCVGGGALPADPRAVVDALVDEYQGAGGLPALRDDLAAALARPAPQPAERSGGSRAAAGGRRSILFVAGMCPSIKHGGGLRLFDIVSELAERHDVDLYARYREEHDRESLELLLPRLRSARLVIADDLDPADVLDWLRRRGRGRYDVIHFEYPGSMRAIVPLRAEGGRALYTMMESATRAATIELARAASQDRPRLAAAAKSLMRSMRLEREALSACDVGIAVTDADADFAVRALGVPRPAIVPTCVSDEAFLKGLPSPIERADDRIVGRSAVFLGYFEHAPNRDALAWYLDAIHPRALARVPDYRVYIVGRGDLSAERARRAGDASIVFVGEVEDLRPHLLAAQIGLAPIVSGAGIRGKINQYSAAGRPTVSTALGASGMQYAHGQSIWIADDPDGFAEGIATLLTDEPRWRQMRDAALHVVREHYLWPQTVRHLEALYDA